jgi:hypothetical protein
VQSGRNLLRWPAIKFWFLKQRVIFTSSLQLIGNLHMVTLIYEMCVHSRQVSAVHRQLLLPMHHVPRVSIALSAWLLNLHPSCGISLEVRRITWFYWHCLSCSWFRLTLKCESIVPDFSKNGANSAQNSARFKKMVPIVPNLCQKCAPILVPVLNLCRKCVFSAPNWVKSFTTVQ